MKANIKRTPFVLLSLLLLFIRLQPLSAQTVWPGDVNNNGIVNSVDLLYWGLAAGTEGPERDDSNTDWSPKVITVPWLESFPDGTNYAYADCDGNGVIDEDDVESAIEENFGLIHDAVLPDGYLNGLGGFAPPIELTPDATVVEPGATVTIDLSLGTEAIPVSQFYGIAFTMSYRSDLVEDEDDSFEVEESSMSWISTDDSDVKQLFSFNDAEGKAEYAVTRMNQQVITEGAGTIATFSIVIEDIIVGLTVDTLKIAIDSIRLIDQELNTYPVAPDTVNIIVAEDSSLVSSSRNEVAPLALKVYPNPNRGVFQVESGMPLSELQLFDSLGRPVAAYVEPLSNHRYRIRPVFTHPGLYCLTGYCGNVRFTRKILINNP